MTVRQLFCQALMFERVDDRATSVLIVLVVREG